MPNSVHLPICPYFRAEKRNSIGCEDIYRRFRWNSQKHNWMYKYCDTDKWSECPYAKNLNAMYERIEKGADMEAEKHVEKVQELEKELKKTSIMLGNAEKRIEEKDKKIEEQKRRIKLLEDHYNVLRRRHKEEQKKTEIEKRNCAKLGKFIEEQFVGYSNRFCFLMSKAGNLEMDEAEYMEWCKNKNCRLESVRDEKGKVLKWKAVIKGGKDAKLS